MVAFLSVRISLLPSAYDATQILAIGFCLTWGNPFLLA
ncbi:hypothetical protein BLGI_4712 [Brevibacillus laterosporus GI-9]|nr:hypothetical protein BLGI_4712 [Brevibacillus laterosporus GI-9]